MKRSPVYSIAYGDPVQGTVVLLHPHNATSEAWNDLGLVVPLTKFGLRVVALDFRGYGRSPKITEKFDYSGDCFVEDISFAIGHQNTGPIHIIGYSIGTAAGLSYTLKYRKRIHSLVLGGLGIGPLAQLGLYVGQDAKDSREKALRQIETVLSTLSGDLRQQFEFAKSLIQEESLRQIVGSDLPSSTLLVSGSDDRFRPNEIYANLNSEKTKVTTEVLEGLGHGDCFTSAIFRELVLKFIAKMLVR